MIRLNGLTLTLDETEDDIAAKAACALGIPLSDIVSLSVIRKALDARRNRPPHFVYAVSINLNDAAALPEMPPEGMQIQPFDDEPDIITFRREERKAPGGRKRPVIVIGSGPAGLFAAYTLAVSGIPVMMLERGTRIEKRVDDVREFWRNGMLHPQSNVLFGEGGAGTFSDGKLTSRSKNPYAAWVKRTLVDMGAPPSILTDAKPHVGTDQLRNIVIRMRKQLIHLGCDVQFESQVTDFMIRGNKMAAVVVNGDKELRTEQVILAIGQSADDTYRNLAEHGVKMEAKPFAMGLRVEHPQTLINDMQYGRWSKHPKLPPAEYFVTAAVREQNRSVYTFCMCPGGRVIGCGAYPDRVITNGMSNSERNEEFANSAVVVNVRVEDFAKEGEPLSGLGFRDLWEKKAFAAGGGDYHAPAQKLTEFVEQKFSGVIGRTSFLPGVRAFRLAEVLPPFVAEALISGIRQFNKKMSGFISQEAHLIGVETRTSSPVRICRKLDGESANIRGLYPCGEGAGYAGGIISSALDGMKAAESVIRSINGSP